MVPDAQDDDLADDFAMAAALGRRQQPSRGAAGSGGSRRPGSGGSNKQQTGGARARRGRGNFTY
jgi:hypothetical protein